MTDDTKEGDMLGMTKNVPEPQKTRYTRRFEMEELKVALREYLERNGVEVPDGESFVWGVENDSYGFSRRITFVVDA